MTPSEIISECDKQISFLGNKANVLLLIPGKWGISSRRQLCKVKGAPFGEIVCDDFGKGLSVMFNAIELRRFILCLSQ